MSFLDHNSLPKYFSLGGLVALSAVLSVLPEMPALGSNDGCPRPVSSTCFGKYVYDRENVPSETREFPAVHLEVFNTTYGYNVESQGTFVPRKACQGFFCPQGKEEVNGFTLFGDFVRLQVRYVPLRRVKLYGGVFFAFPFGGEDTLEDVRPIFTLDYEPVEGVNFLAGTLQPRHLFFDAVFDDLMYFIRPVEQGFQFLVNTKHYQQDLFINWQQENTRITNERFNVGYVGKITFGPVRVNGQIHWDHVGGEIPFPDFRPLETRNNLVWAGGPELEVSPSAHVARLWWLKAVGARLIFMGTDDQPNSRTPQFTTAGHGYELRGWVDISMWRLAAARWKGDNFVASLGDRFFGVPEMTEVSVATTLPIVQQVALEFGGLIRFIESTGNETMANVVYAAAHWNMDFNLGSLITRAP